MDHSDIMDVYCLTSAKWCVMLVQHTVVVVMCLHTHAHCGETAVNEFTYMCISSYTNAFPFFVIWTIKYQRTSGGRHYQGISGAPELWMWGNIASSC